MTNYKAILLYHSKGNTTTQVATICQCSRTTVLKVIKRATELNLKLPLPDSLSDKDIYFMLYPTRDRNEEYYLPNWSELDKDRLKRSFSKYRAWQKYCRVAKKLGLKAYGKSRFYDLYNDYFFVSNSASQECSGEVLAKIKYFEDGLEMIVNTCGMDSDPYRFFIEERSEWCKEMKLDKAKIW